MRAAFVELSDWLYGPESTFGPPDTQYAADIPSRFVPQRQIDQYTIPFDMSVGWVTLDEFKPNVALPVVTALGKTCTNWLSSDRVRVSFQPGKTFYVVRVEKVNPVYDPPYWRALVADVDTIAEPPWPPPEECPCAPPCPCLADPCEFYRVDGDVVLAPNDPPGTGWSGPFGTFTLANFGEGGCDWNLYTLGLLVGSTAGWDGTGCRVFNDVGSGAKEVCCFTPP